VQVMFMAESISALLTPLIALIAIYIAWQQWRTNQQKLDLERYDRRLQIYKEIQTLIGVVIRKGDAPFEAIVQLRINSAEADFLFGPDIRVYIEEVVDHALNLSNAHRQYDDAIKGEPWPDYDRQKVVAIMHDECIWISNQQPVALERFRKYLAIGDDRHPFFKALQWKRRK
jgi:hypothetical protein